MSFRADWTVNFTTKGYRRYFIEIQKQGLGPLDFWTNTRIANGQYGENGCGTRIVTISSAGGLLRSYHWGQIKTALEKVPKRQYAALAYDELNDCKAERLGELRDKPTDIYIPPPDDEQDA